VLPCAVRCAPEPEGWGLAPEYACYRCNQQQPRPSLRLVRKYFDPHTTPRFIEPSWVFSRGYYFPVQGTASDAVAHLGLTIDTDFDD